MSPRSHQSPPRWLMASLLFCLTALLVGFLTYSEPYSNRGIAAEPTASPTPAATPSPTPTPTPTPAPTPTPTPEPTETPLPVADFSQPVPAGESAEAESWFQDAVFIGDSRTDGLHLYSGIQGGTFLVHTGLSVFDVVKERNVLGSGDNKYSIYSVLRKKQFGKVYVSLGVNELGYNKEKYVKAVNTLIDDLRAFEPDATIYIQSIIPVNSAICRSKNQPAYVNNTAIGEFNAALQTICEEKQVWYVNLSEALTDADSGELPADMTRDGIHCTKAGYEAWLAYLLNHTGEGFVAPEPDTAVEEPTASATPAPTPVPTQEPTPTPAPTPVG